MLRAASVVALATVSLAGAATPLDLTSRRLSQTTGTFTFTGGDPGEGLDFIGDFVYAVDMSGPGGVTIGDAVFTSDGTTPGFSVSAEHSYTTWESRPGFGSSSNDNALELLMHSIRWSGYQTPVTVTMEVEQGTYYRLQLLFYEQCCRRGFDVLVDGMRIVDEYSPEIEQGGRTGTSRPGAAIYHEFVATSSTTTVELDGRSSSFGDNNPISNAVTLESLGESGDSSVSFVYVDQVLCPGFGPSEYCNCCGDCLGEPRLSAPACPTPSCTITVMSAGANDGNTCSFTIESNSGATYTKEHNVDAFICSRGFNLLVLDSNDCSIVQENSFDTYLSTGQSDLMKTYVENLPFGSIVLVAVRDEASRNLTPELEQAMARAFSVQDFLSGNPYNGISGQSDDWRDSYAAILVKDCSPPLDEQRKAQFAGPVDASFESTATPEPSPDRSALCACAEAQACCSSNSGCGEESEDDDDSDDNSLVVILCVVVGALLVGIAILAMMKRRKPEKPPHGRRGPVMVEAATSPTPPQQPALASIKAEALGMMSEEPIAEAIPQGHVSGAEAAAMAAGEPPPQPSVGWGRRFASWRAVAEPPPPPEAEFEPEI